MVYRTSWCLLMHEPDFTSNVQARNSLLPFMALLSVTAFFWWSMGASRGDQGSDAASTSHSPSSTPASPQRALFMLRDSLYAQPESISAVLVGGGPDGHGCLRAAAECLKRALTAQACNSVHCDIAVGALFV